MSESPQKKQEMSAAELPILVFGDLEGRFEPVIESWKKLALVRDEFPMIGTNRVRTHKFVYIGDVIDKGPENLKIMDMLERSLCNSRQGDPVDVFVVGNRDVNKLRLWFELYNYGNCKADCLDMTTDSDVTFRVPGWKDEWERYVAAEKARNPEFEYSHGKKTALEDMVFKARFLFEKTMGCPQTFDLIVSEVRKLQDDPDCSLVYCLETYLSYFTPRKGSFFNSLLRGRIIYRQGSSLFVHGGISASNYLMVPPSTKGGEWHKSKDFDTWLKELQNWYLGCLLSYAEGELEGVIPLLEYQEPPVVNGKWNGKLGNPTSVIHTRVFTDDLKVEFPDPAVMQDLKKNGIKRIVHGHSPVGDVALYRYDPVSEIAIVSTDTSASGGLPSYIELSEDSVQIDGFYRDNIFHCDSRDHRAGKYTPQKGYFFGESQVGDLKGEHLYIDFEAHPAGFVVPKYSI